MSALSEVSILIGQRARDIEKVGSELTAEVAFNDTKSVLEFLLATEAGLGEAVGLEAADD